jgi:hypothetical protein
LILLKITEKPIAGKVEASQQKKEVIMNYTKPKVLAQNASQGSFAAGCPLNNNGGTNCRNCERTS